MFDHSNRRHHSRTHVSHRKQRPNPHIVAMQHTDAMQLRRDREANTESDRLRLLGRIHKRRMHTIKSMWRWYVHCLDMYPE